MKKNKESKTLIDIEENMYRVLKVERVYTYDYESKETTVYETNDLNEAMNFAYLQSQKKVNENPYGGNNMYGVERKVNGEYKTICSFGYIRTIKQNDPWLIGELKRYQLDTDIAKKSRDDYIKKHEKEVKEKERFQNKYNDITLELEELKSHVELLLILEKHTENMTHEEYNKYQQAKKKLKLK